MPSYCKKKFSELEKLLEEKVFDPKKKPILTPMIWGPPGIGKSAMIKLIGKKRGLKVIDLRASQIDATDIRGIPYPNGDSDGKKTKVRWLIPEFLPSEEEEPCILFIDEVNRCRPDVLQSLFQLVLDRRVGMYQFPSHSFIICAGNLGEDDMTSVVEMDSALNNRFMHFYLDSVVPETIKYFRKQGYSEHIIAFLKAKPNYHLKVPQNEDERAWPSPRSWENLAIMANDDLADDKNINISSAIDLATACVGSPAAGEWGKYLQILVIISPTDVLNNYDKIKAKFKKQNRENVYSLCASIKEHITKLGKKLTVENCRNLVKFGMDQLSGDHQREFLSGLVEIDTLREKFLTIPEFKDKVVDWL